MANEVPLPNRDDIDTVREARIYAVDQGTGDQKPLEADNGELRVTAEIGSQPSFDGLTAFETEQNGQLTSSDVARGAEVLLQANPENVETAFVGPAGGPYVVALEPGDGFETAVSNTDALGVDLASGDSLIVCHEVTN